ncbi:N-glycanase Pngl [Anticarsia gemmatalis]|uniref:N-glycanase Pngl n=1 Tax=Anticarsia gemmatalis TaxID=129554 RepID=UPI003F7627ED
MEDMARLAVVEQSVRDVEKFNKILYELLRHISNILENPHDNELRTLKRDYMKEMFSYDAFFDYLKYVGFVVDGENLVYSKESTLSNLRMAQAAIERKISFCSGAQISRLNLKSSSVQLKKSVLRPTNILTTNNPLLLKIEQLFNHVLEYEDEELQALAREQIPLVTLQLMALDRVREQQKKIKTGETKEPDLPFDVALLMELLVWFKYKFFSWVDKPPCDRCAGPTVLSKKITVTSEQETCLTEVYACGACGASGGARFPRYNRPRTLLRTRRGRCGEWANCFALLCRALGYDTRYVYDTTDHVWCEVFDYDSKTWLHADPCEGALDAPLMYEHGWGKRLSYVIAVSRDDLQDVTWRYSLNHKETVSRRSACSERELVSCLVALREHRQRHVTEARRHYLTQRTLAELVLLMQQRKPEDYESHGRISGSKQWRSDRGEAGRGHTFEFSEPGACEVRYHTGADTYWVTEAGRQPALIKGWAAGVYEAKNVFRKEEHDWQQAYLAREEGSSAGWVSWVFAAGGERRLRDMRVRLSSAQFDTGLVRWTVQYDDRPPQPLHLDESGAGVLAGEARRVALRGALSGGRGDCAWQHAQLCRAPLAPAASAPAPPAALEFHAHAL